MELLIVVAVIAIGCYLLGGLARKRKSTLIGKAYVTDGDGIRVSGQEVRIAGLDAPEFDQVARHRDGYWYPHGRHVKSALIREIGGKRVHVTVERYDKFGRAIGIVTYDNMDVGELLTVFEKRAILCDLARFLVLSRCSCDRSASSGVFSECGIVLRWTVLRWTIFFPGGLFGRVSSDVRDVVRLT